ncbi:MAG TPA: feruloyl-CoA synthase [Vicinamibacterales bacterium]|nr:feruloyl-CoA synthase [Vicinamibacterales bacterium]
MSTTIRLAPAQVVVERRDDGTSILRSPEPLAPFARVVGEWLVQWAAREPDRCFLAERRGEQWRRVTYAGALDATRRIGTSLLERGLTAATPVAILSDNSIDHALLTLGAMHAGIVVAPISPAYSLVSRDHAKLKAIFELLRPGVVFAEDPGRFAPALAAVGATSTSIEALLETDPSERIDRAFAAIGPETIAKILFTSGSTGTPKGVINTQQMLCSNQQGWAQIWPFLEDTPPVLCEWLPWNHTFGGNATFNMVLRNGGTLYIDGGKPMPDLIALTARNLREVSPTLYFNVPRGFDLLLPLLESDDLLRQSFFAKLDAMFYAGAALPQNLYNRLRALAASQSHRRVFMLSGWGSTETAPGAAVVNFPIDGPEVVGNPLPGVELKLVPSGTKLEVRVRGPNVTPGYFGNPDLTRAAFDDDGFYKIGDAMRFVDADHPARGLAFDGRVIENFKLQSGTWVHAGAVRVRLIAACNPLVQDAVITGHDRNEIGALVWVNPMAVRALALDEDGVRTRLREALAILHAESTGGSSAPCRLLVLEHPPSIDEGEITDKGYINQRAVLERRAAHVDALHAGGANVISVASMT